MKFSVSLAFVFIAMYCHSQSLHEPLNTIALQTGKYSNNQSNSFYFSGNPAILGFGTHRGAGVYHERRFLLSELSSFLATAVFSINGAGFGVIMNRYGSVLHNQTMVALAYGRRLTDRIAIGAQLNYITGKSQGFSPATTATATIGAVFRLSNNLSTGVAAKHIGTLKKDLNNKVAANYSVGFCYDVSSAVSLNMDIIIAVGQSLSATAGIIYRVIKNVELTAGITTGTSVPFVKCGFIWKQLRLDVMVGYHMQLGITPGIAIQFGRER